MSRISTQVGMGPVEAAAAGWQPLKVGGGGWVTGISISDDGVTKAIRTDTYGGYVWSTGDTAWRQLVTVDSMPAGSAGAGVYELCVAPSDSTILYMQYTGKMYKSIDTGATWTACTNWTTCTDGSNDGGATDPPARAQGPKMAVDPVNPDVVYVGTPANGVWYTTDGGSNWSQISTSTIPISGMYGDARGGHRIWFDAAGGTSGSPLRTDVLIITSYGNGVYRSTNQGGSWATISSGGPVNVLRGCISGASVFYCVAYATSQGHGYNDVWKWSPSTWTDINPGGSANYWASITADPFNSARVMVCRSGGTAFVSTDSGASWTDAGGHTRTAESGEAEWLAWSTVESYMSCGEQVFDPVTQNKVWFVEGIGAWYATVVGAPSGGIQWNAISKGIEQLSPIMAFRPPGRPNVILSAWDRPIFLKPAASLETFPSTYEPGAVFNAGWGVDYSTANPARLAAIFSWVDNLSGWSDDDGETWTQFATLPASVAGDIPGGCIAYNGIDNIIYVVSNSKAPYYTTDRGGTWTKLSLPGIADTDNGWYWLHRAMFLNRHVVCADRVNANTFYLVHPGAATASPPLDNPPAVADGRIFKTTDGGATWSSVYSGTPNSNGSWDTSVWNTKLRSAPGNAGHLWLCQGPDRAHGLDHSTDGGATWTEPNENWTLVHAFGFGKAIAGGYPAIFAYGTLSGTRGVYRSDDEGVTWTQIGDQYPIGWIGDVQWVDGDPEVFGRCYIAQAGMGWIYYEP